MRLPRAFSGVSSKARVFVAVVATSTAIAIPAWAGPWTSSASSAGAISTAAIDDFKAPDSSCSWNNLSVDVKWTAAARTPDSNIITTLTSSTGVVAATGTAAGNATSYTTTAYANGASQMYSHYFKTGAQKGTNWLTSQSPAMPIIGCDRWVNSWAGNGNAGTTGLAAGTPWATGSFNSPSQIFRGGGVAYMADTGTNSLVSLDYDTGKMTTYAGVGSTTGGYLNHGSNKNLAKFRAPQGIWASSPSSVVGDTGNNVVRQINGSVVTTLAGPAPNGNGDPAASGFADGTGTAALFSGPTSIVFQQQNSTADVFVSDTGNNAIRSISQTTVGQTLTLAGNGSAGYADGTGPVNKTGIGGTARFNSPHGLATMNNSNVIFVADTNNNAIRRVDVTGTTASVTTIAGLGPSSPGTTDGNATIAKFNKPEGLSVDSAGNIYVADTGNSRIRIIPKNSDGTYTTVYTLAGTDSGNFGDGGGSGRLAKFDHPRSLAIDNGTGANLRSTFSNVFVVDTGNNRIRELGRVPAAAAVAPYGVFTTETPANLVSNDSATYELGMRFKSSAAGFVTGLRYYSAANQVSGTPIAHLWASGNTTALATMTMPAFNGTTGWKTVYFNSPIALTVGADYVVSYYDPGGQYPYTAHGFDTAATNGALTAPIGAGVFNSSAGGSGAYPNNSFNNNNYFIDPVFQPS